MRFYIGAVMVFAPIIAGFLGALYAGWQEPRVRPLLIISGVVLLVWAWFRTGIYLMSRGDK